ncbi:uncharacterized protein LOC101854267 [Aplysia californica]|uniref:Uncharacterized protein LOC101854267 n=1 Tax=Aplysia californica TaxID=6500 RepID=A0ABM1A5D4_APLCA|nr:uncharacterized protein LOC101854267 [Aplysia californica]
MLHLVVLVALAASPVRTSELGDLLHPIVSDELGVMESNLDELIKSVGSHINSGSAGGDCCSSSSGRNPGQSFDVFGDGGSYYLAFRGTAGVGRSVYDAYVKDDAINYEPCCKQVNGSLPCSAHYRNNAILDDWQFIEEVVLAVYERGVIKQALTFDAAGTDYLSWFSPGNLKGAGKWEDLKEKTTNFFSIAGDAGLKRRFYINQIYLGCLADIGWFMAMDNPLPPCQYEKHSSYPQFLYSSGTGRMTWSSSGELAQADVMAVFVKFYKGCSA